MDLWYCGYASHDANENRHPQVVMRELGITYELGIPQSIADGWEFRGCVLPEGLVLPSYLREMKPKQVAALDGRTL